METISTAMTTPRDTITKCLQRNSYDGMMNETSDDMADLILSDLRNARPRIVCLCGSTRFYEAFQRANYLETMKGCIVLTVGFYPHSSEQAHGQHVGCDDEHKQELDRLHLKKIDLADEILVLNVGGYIGDSTRREIEHATRTGKPIRWLEPHAA